MLENKIRALEKKQKKLFKKNIGTVQRMYQIGPVKINFKKT